MQALLAAVLTQALHAWLCCWWSRDKLLHPQTHLRDTQHLVLVHIQLPRHAPRVCGTSNANECEAATQGLELFYGTLLQVLDVKNDR